MIPKYHAAKHLAFELRTQLLSGAARVMNPGVYNTESNEDHVEIGRAHV